MTPEGKKMSVSKPYKIKRIDENKWLIPKTGKMRVPGLIFANSKLLPDIEKDSSPDQIFNVAHLPGIVGYAVALPDMHWGYGFPIGGVAAFDAEEGIVSPGGVGYDINCGVRLATTSVARNDLEPHISGLIDSFYSEIPIGLGSTGAITLKKKDLFEVSRQGALWAVKKGMGEQSDLERIEDHGAIESAATDSISDRAYERGKDQIGTLGSGNHFIEIGYVERVFEETTANEWGLREGLVTLMIHSGSRGFGYQICDEFLARMVKSVAVQKIELLDRQLACAYLKSEVARQYLGAMAAAANFAFANRQILMNLARLAWEKTLKISPRELNLRLLYDVCHNIAKMERHEIDGVSRMLCVHRKGATRALPPDHPLLPPLFRKTGQPVLIPGDMGRFSYVMAGVKRAEDQAFNSACHGAGRVLSRNEALRKTKGRVIERELQNKHVYSRAAGRKTMREECPEAYKNVDDVVEIVSRAGLARKIVRIRPMGVIKG